MIKKELRINEFLTIKLDGEETVIYVGGDPFLLCKYLLLINPEKYIKEEIDSIDEAADIYKKRLEGEHFNPLEVGITPEIEFLGHCSNLQVWVEYDYDTRLLHSNLSFPLLKKLTEVGDKNARDVFKEEIAKRLSFKNKNVGEFLLENDFIKYLSREELFNCIFPIGSEKEIDFCIEIEKINSIRLVPRFIEERNSSIWVGKEGITEIIIEGCRLKILPNSIGNLKSVNKLRLDYNLITALPDSIGNLSTLRNLSLQYNKIKTLPKSISNLNSLQYLYLNNNELTTLPDSIGNLKSLRYLFLDNNQLTALPDSIGNLNSLQYLSLENNQLSIIPESIGKLESLQELILSGNQVKHLPESIGALKSLQTICLDKNVLITLPESVGNLKSLRILH